MTEALRWFIVLTRSVCYLGNHVTKAMRRHDVRRGCSLKELSTKAMQGCVVAIVRFLKEASSCVTRKVRATIALPVDKYSAFQHMAF